MGALCRQGWIAEPQRSSLVGLAKPAARCSRREPRHRRAGVATTATGITHSGLKSNREFNGHGGTASPIWICHKSQHQ
jgi:hypothetical protein